ncbi:MAG TPA: hypothetical protein VFM58_08875 [Solirubrobacteraceae bacterium]|nr:hypothetical protein [Solirubrobacteraceae bacterium]
MGRRVVAIAVLGALAAVCHGCGASETSPPPAATSGRVVVPRVVGMPRTRATCELAGAGLRWRSAGESRTHRRPLLACDDEGAAVAPDPTIEQQRPEAGRRVRRGSVVVLEDECTLLRFAPRGAACL